MRNAVVEVDLDAIRHNVAVLVERSAPAAVCAVVKADGYGHGAVEVAGAALEAGASWLAVALVEEGLELRAAGIEAPILVLSEPPAVAMGAAIEADLVPTVYTEEGVAAAAGAAQTLRRSAALHLKVDTGMQRVGCRPDEAVDFARRIADHPHLILGGTFTHFATADEPERPATAAQLSRYRAVLAGLRTAGLHPGIRHAANSAGAIAHPRSRFDLVRCGIAVYGSAPSPAVAGLAPLRPAMRVVSEVSYVKRVEAGSGVSYGLRHTFAAPATVATVPVGYADGVPRRLGLVGGEVLVRGRRCPIVGVVTMDQLMVDVTALGDVRRGEEVVVLGAQGDEVIDAWEHASMLDTISYELLCGFRLRLPRRYVGGTT